jgi:hypothetical protein
VVMRDSDQKRTALMRLAHGFAVPLPDWRD